jgi:hypothetical protein
MLLSNLLMPALENDFKKLQAKNLDKDAKKKIWRKFLLQ